jgi:hypothetical protein
MPKPVQNGKQTVQNGKETVKFLASMRAENLLIALCWNNLNCYVP